MTVMERLYTEYGQSPWLDNLTRGYLREGTLARLVGEGIRGVTANPTIVAKAIAGSRDYDKETLVSNGQVERTTADSGSPGRPPQLFQAVRRMDPMGARHFRVLAEVLAGAIDTAADPGDRILRAGQQWGRRQASMTAGPGKASGPAEPVDRLMRLLDELGFAPERDDSDGRRVGLRQCPFLELAVSRSDVVCPAHLGLMQGAMQAWESPITVERLHPFVEPDLCMAHLGPAGES